MDQILDDAEEKRQEVLQKCFEMFKKNELDLIENAASIVNLQKNKIDLELYSDENGEMVKTQFICPECGKNEFAYVGKSNQIVVQNEDIEEDDMEESGEEENKKKKRH